MLINEHLNDNKLLEMNFTQPLWSLIIVGGFLICLVPIVKTKILKREQFETTLSCQ